MKAVFQRYIKMLFKSIGLYGVVAMIHKNVSKLHWLHWVSKNASYIKMFQNSTGCVGYIHTNQACTSPKTIFEDFCNFLFSIYLYTLTILTIHNYHIYSIYTYIFSYVKPTLIETDSGLCGYPVLSPGGVK